MPCCLMVLAALFPRLLLVVMWLTQYTATAFVTYLWPLLGFFFMPATTCGYAIAVNTYGEVRGMGLLFVVIGVILDLTTAGGGADSSMRYGYARVSRR